MKNKIYIVFLILVGITILNFLYDSHKQEAIKEQKVLDRPEYQLDDKKLSNILLLGDLYKSNKKNWYEYMPSSKQMLENIPQCMQSQSAEIKAYINSYDKIAKYLYENNKILKESPTQLYKATKMVMDYDYNYYNYDYFSSLVDLPRVSVLNNIALNSILGTFSVGNTVDAKEILNVLFTKEEQIKLAKDTLAIYNQSRDNCVQAGFGDEFYAVYWAGMAEGYYPTSQFIMQEGVITVAFGLIQESKNDIIQNKMVKEILKLLNFYQINYESKSLSDRNRAFIVSMIMNSFDYVGGYFSFAQYSGAIESGFNKKMIDDYFLYKAKPLYQAIYIDTILTFDNVNNERINDYCLVLSNNELLNTIKKNYLKKKYFYVINLHEINCKYFFLKEINQKQQKSKIADIEMILNNFYK